MVLLLLCLVYLLAAVITRGWVLSASLDLLVWAWMSSPTLMTLLGVAIALGVGAALVYPRYRRGVVLTRTVVREALPVTPGDGGTAVTDYLAGLAADRWRESNGSGPDTWADVVELDIEHERRWAA